jgi:hypothetical protein
MAMLSGLSAANLRTMLATLRSAIGDPPLQSTPVRGLRHRLAPVSRNRITWIGAFLDPPHRAEAAI